MKRRATGAVLSSGEVEEFSSNFVHNGSYLLRGESVKEAHVTRDALSGESSSSGEVSRYCRPGLEVMGGGGGVQQQKRSCRREKPRMSFVFFVLFCSFLKHL